MSKKNKLDEIKQSIKGRTPQNQKLFYLEGEYYLIQGHTLTGLTTDEIPGFLKDNAPELVAFNCHPLWDKEQRDFNNDTFRASLPTVIKSSKILPVVSEERALTYMELLRSGRVTEYFEILTPGIDRNGTHYPGVTLFQGR